MMKTDALGKFLLREGACVLILDAKPCSSCLMHQLIETPVGANPGYWGCLRIIAVMAIRTFLSATTVAFWKLP